MAQIGPRHQGLLEKIKRGWFAGAGNGARYLPGDAGVGMKRISVGPGRLTGNTPCNGFH
ncbi:hypothetical protein F01_440063 [Burkholderia cenocepacia]|nr:hypothetical protein F01_440063 [Burkholderia cenocepacia]